MIQNKTDTFLKDLELLGYHSLNEKQKNQFNRYYELLIEWNNKMNLTSITAYDEVMKKHFIDSLSIIHAGIDIDSKKIIDVGTGAGFPGIPIKILFPNTKIMLLDSLNKRITFLNEVIDQLELKDINTVHDRAEDGAKNKLFREQYDICVSRAVSNLSSLSEMCIPFVKKDGYFISYKSGTCMEEIEQSKNALKILGGNLLRIEQFQLPNSDIDRTLLIIKKVKATPGTYPRKAGTPLKNPL